MSPGTARPGLAARLNGVSVAANVAMTAKARAMRAQGIDVIALTIGEPDFPTPDHAIEAALQAARRGETRYPPGDGTPALKAAIIRKFARENGLDFAPDEIMVANGGKQVIFDALMATVDPGDEVVIPAPYWGAYPLMARLLGGVPVAVHCAQDNGFRLRAEDLDAAITPRSKWLMLNFPNNPTGAAMPRAGLEALAAVLRRHPHLWIMSDEIYEHLVYDGEHASIAAVAPDLRDRTLIVNGVSKTYAMTGWRVGYGAGPRDLIRAMVNVQGHATAGVSSVGQAAAAAALDGDPALIRERAGAYRRRRDLVVDALNTMPGITCHRPDGAFYVYPSVAGCLGRTAPGGQCIATDDDFTLALLEHAHVAVAPGAAFGMSPYIRISTAADDATLAEACRRIGAFCAGLA